MEISAHYSLVSNSHAQLLKPCSSFSTSQGQASFFHSKAKSKAKASPLLAFQGQGVIRIKTKQLTSSICASSSSKAETPPPPPTTDFSQRWLLEPVGDGDTSHIGFKVPMPNAFEISSNDVTVGRLPEKADMVIPVATVSGAHARIQKKEVNLLVTDLGSTNGTFVDEKRLTPGVVATAPPGSYVIFGDEHLAVFRVSKLENVEAASTPDAVEDKVETDIPSGNTETS